MSLLCFIQSKNVHRIVLVCPWMLIFDVLAGGALHRYTGQEPEGVGLMLRQAG